MHMHAGKEQEYLYVKLFQTPYKMLNIFEMSPLAALRKMQTQSCNRSFCPFIDHSCSKQNDFTVFSP